MIGADLSTAFYGGDKPHIGAVAIVQRTPRAKDPNAYTITPSVLSMVGHKEYGLAQELAMMLAKELQINVVTLCGIHVAGADQEAIQTIVDLCKEITKEYLG